MIESIKLYAEEEEKIGIWKENKEKIKIEEVKK